MSTRTVLILPALGALLLTACSNEPCEGTSGGLTANYNDPFESSQDIELVQSIYEVEQMATGEEATVQVEIANSGGVELVISDFAFTEDSDANWTFNADQLPITVPRDETRTLEVHYVAQGGPDTYAVGEITSNDPHPNEGTVSVGFHGVSSGELAEVAMVPPEVDFGFTFRGEEVRRTFQVRNEGTAPLELVSVETTGSFGDTLHLACPGASLQSCNWQQAILPILQQAPIEPGGSVEIEVAYTPTNQQAQSGQIVITTTDPQRPEMPVLVRGNSSIYNCTPPTITNLITPGPLEYPSMATMDLEVSLEATDTDQPINSIVVDMFVSGEPKEDAFTDPTGLAEFDLDLSNTDPLEGPVFTQGLHTILLEAKDTCQLVDQVTLVAAIGRTLSANDGDGDGYDSTEGDCDDADPTAYPAAIELLDGKDNDCDGVADNDTEVWDDDCDGFCESSTECLGQGPAEDGGACAVPLAANPYDDCNDSVRDIDEDDLFDGTGVNPEATEGQNRRDDDCDGIVDEDTNFYDDDGDGFTESTGDCDDDDPTTFGGAGGGFEFCDGADNDCDGQTDENCFSDTAAPRVVGLVNLSQFEVPLGETVTATVIVLSEDEGLTYSWSADIGSFPDGSSGASVSWTAPPADKENLATLGGAFANLIVTVTDSEGRSTQGFTEVLLWVSEGGAFTTTCGCNAAGAAPLDAKGTGSTLLLVLAAAVLRNRRRDARA